MAKHVTVCEKLRKNLVFLCNNNIWKETLMLMLTLMHYYDAHRRSNITWLVIHHLITTTILLCKEIKVVGSWLWALNPLGLNQCSFGFKINPTGFILANAITLKHT